jgi:hypothetical protein
MFQLIQKNSLAHKKIFISVLRTGSFCLQLQIDFGFFLIYVYFGTVTHFLHDFILNRVPIIFAVRDSYLLRIRCMHKLIFS